MNAPLLVKVGGSLEDPAGLLDDLAGHPDPLVIVHGGHRARDRLSAQLGHPPRTVTSASGATTRYTDATGMDHMLMAYCGLVGKRVVLALQSRGRRAVGLAALDGGMVRGRRRADIRVREAGRTVVLHGDHAGTIHTVDVTLLRSLSDAGITPVVCPPALGDDGAPINVDGDRLAAELAVALGAARLVIFSDTAGLLADLDDPESVVREATLDDIASLGALARDRARTKLAAVSRALRGGVAAVGLCDGRRDRPLVDALAGAGTWFGVGQTSSPGDGSAPVPGSLAALRL